MSKQNPEKEQRVKLRGKAKSLKGKRKEASSNSRKKFLLTIPALSKKDKKSICKRISQLTD